MKLNRKQRRTLKIKGVKMKQRTEEAIRKEYLDLCGRAGEAQARDGGRQAQASGGGRGFRR